MMTAKTRGNGLVVPFDESDRERPSEDEIRRDDVRSIAHLKMLQSLSGKLSRLNDVAQIGLTISDELRLLDRLPQLPRLPPRRGRPRAGRLPRRPHGRDRGRPGRSSCRRASGRGITGPRRRDRRATPRRRRRAARVRRADRRHRRDRGVAARRAAEVRRARHRRDRDLEARARPVRRRRPPPARGDGGARVGRARERASLRGSAPRGRERESASRVLARSRRSRRASVEVAERVAARRRAASSQPEHLRLAPGRRPTAPSCRLAPVARSPPSDDGLDPDPGRATSSRGSRRTRAVHRRARGLRGDRARRPRHGGPVRDRPVHRRRALGRRRGRDRRRSRATATASSSSSRASRGRRSSRSRPPRATRALERTFLSTVEALANALEANDEYTSTHARWITDLALRVGEELGLEPQELKRLELGALFHDIGKIGIPARDPREAGPAHTRGARARRDAPDPRRAHPRPDRAARRGAAHRPLRATSTTTERATPTTSPASRSRSSRGSSSPATPSTR